MLLLAQTCIKEMFFFPPVKLNDSGALLIVTNLSLTDLKNFNFQV